MNEETPQTRRPFRITRRGDMSSRPAVAHASDAIRVSRKTVRPLRIISPPDGAAVDGFAATIKGSGNPGDTLKLSCSSIKSVKCRVKNDGSWTMSDIAFAQGPQEVTIENLDHPGNGATIRLFVSQISAITVASPLPGETVEAKFIEVTGKASPGRLLCLRLGRKTQTERASESGSFRFSDVELPAWGDQQLMLYYAEVPSEGNTDIELHWPGLDLPSLVDPVTRSHLKPGADIVRCSNCYTYCYRATWVRVGKCPRCDTSKDYWTRTVPIFHTPRANLRM